MSGRRAREKPFVCVDIDLPSHTRLMACGDPAGCLGLWTAMLCYAREHLTDGMVPKRFATSIWGDKKNPGRLADMVREKLLAEHETAYEVLRYAPRNQTKTMVEAAREAARVRMAARREKTARSSVDVRSNISEQPGDVPISTSISISDPDLGEGSGERDDATPPPPASGRLPLHVVRPQQEFWIAAYERAIDEARGDGRWCFPRKALSALVSVLEKHCLGEDRQNFDAWIERDVGEFVRAVRSLEQPPKSWLAFGPDALLDWHNQDRPGRRAPRPTRPTEPAKPPEGPTLSASENAANAARIASMLAGGPLGQAG